MPRVHCIWYNFWLSVFCGMVSYSRGFFLFGSYSKLHALHCTHVFSLPNRIWLRKSMLFCTILLMKTMFQAVVRMSVALLSLTKTQWQNMLLFRCL